MAAAGFRRTVDDIKVKLDASQKKADSQRTLPPLVEPAPGEQTDLAPGVSAAPPSRIPLYIALLAAIIALLVGLIWLVSQR